MSISKIVQLILVSAVLAACFASAIPSEIDLKAVEARLRQQMVGKVAVLRNFYKGSDLTFDSQGKLVGDSKTGPWTYYARVEVSSVNLTPDSLIVKGARNVVKWELSASEFQNYTLTNQPVRIAVQMHPGFTESTLASAISKVFLTRETRLSDMVPDFWKEVLTTDRARRAVWDQKKTEAMKRVSALSSQISAPKLLSRADGIDTSASPFKTFAANNLILSFVVSENGDVEQLQIDKPVGLGLDDAVVETILHWKWQPAMRDDKAVAVLMHAKVLFPAEKDRLDPHILGCEAPCDLQKTTGRN